MQECGQMHCPGSSGVVRHYPALSFVVQKIYDHIRPRAVEPAQDTSQPEQGTGPNAEGDNSDAEMAKILNDVEELFGEPVFLTH